MIKRKVIRRIAIVATALAALMSFAMTALAAGRPTRRPHPAVRAQLALSSARPGHPVEPGTAEGAGCSGCPAGIDPPDAHDGDRSDRGVRRGQRNRGRRPAVPRRPPRPAPRIITGGRRRGGAHRVGRLASQPATDHRRVFSTPPSSQLASGPSVQEGVSFGDRVADAVLAARANDGADLTPPAFTPGNRPRGVPAHTADVRARGIHPDIPRRAVRAPRVRAASGRRRRRH